MVLAKGIFLTLFHKAFESFWRSTENLYQLLKEW